jgi:hypothetical protein
MGQQWECWVLGIGLLYAVFMLCKQSCTKSPIHLTSWKLESTCKMWCSSPLASHRWLMNETTANKRDYSQDSTVSAIDGKLWDSYLTLSKCIQELGHTKSAYTLPRYLILWCWHQLCTKNCYMPKKMIENEMDTSFTIKEIVHLKLGTLTRAKSWDRWFITMEVLPFCQIPIPRTAH